MKQQLYVFDFDGTLTKHDTFLPFAKHVVGRKKLAAVLLRHIHLLIGMKIHLADNGKVKEQIITALFKNRTQQEMDTHCRQFAEKSNTLWRQNAITLLNKLTEQQKQIIIITASLGCYVRPVVHRRYPNINIIATEHQTDNEGNWTGKLKTKNCYGQEKINRLKQQDPHITQYHIIAYGDSKGDKQLMAIADEKHYRTL